MLRVYRSVLTLYPAAYRRVYAEEMLAVLAEIEFDAAEQRGWSKFARRVRETSGLLAGAATEHTRQCLGYTGASIFLPGRTRMRSEFRFPKATAVLMTVVLVAVLMAIEKAKAISASIPPNSTPVGPIQPEHFSTVTTFLVILALALSAAAIGWLVTFALRRSGVQRFSAVHPGKPTV